MASLCSLERVVRPAPTERMARRTDGDPGGGMMGAAAGKGRTEERTGLDDGPAGRRTGTRVNVEEREHAHPRRTPRKDSGPNGLKLSDRGWRSKGWKNKKDATASLCSLQRVVRPPAYRGVSGPPEGPMWTPAGEGRVLPPGRGERRNRLAERTDALANDPSGNRRVLARTRNRRATGNRGSGNRRATKEPTGEKLLA